jgi:hypothetical protein
MGHGENNHDLSTYVTITNREKQAYSLLERAIDRLQCYCAELNTEMNDSLAMEIQKFLGDGIWANRNKM